MTQRGVRASTLCRFIIVIIIIVVVVSVREISRSNGAGGVALAYGYIVQLASVCQAKQAL